MQVGLTGRGYATSGAEELRHRTKQELVLAMHDHDCGYAASGAEELQHQAKQELVLALHDHVCVNASDKAHGTCAPASGGGSVS